MKYLGIDFGLKRVGLATSDDTGKLAFPYKVLLNDKNVLENIAKIIEQESVGAIVVGESKNFAGEPNSIMKDIEKFKKALAEKTGLVILFEPEFLTSSQAKQTQGENSMHDASAAAIILQSYLDKNRPVI